MICLDCVRKDFRSVCGYCGECACLCKMKCPRRLRANAIDKASKPVVYSVEKTEPLARKYDLCRQVACRKAFKVEHTLQVYCSPHCGRKDRNLNYRISRASAGLGPRPDRPAPLVQPQERQ